MPYWNRNHALQRTLDSYRFYSDIEVIVVDDGSPHQAEPPKTTFPTRVIRLPYKPMPKNPCVPINVGIKEANGDWICITNPEIWHPQPVFHKMMTDDYVLAACWDAKRDKWLCHSSRKHDTPMPPGYGLHFCGVLPSSKIELFDEGYRDGRGYDDNDWAWELHAKGIECVIRDDLVVMHSQDEKVRWKMPSNHKRFYEKWNLS